MSSSTGSRMSTRWTDQDTETLIKAYATDGIPLWNTFFEAHGSNARSEALQKITSAMQKRGFTEREVRAKIIYIRTQYKNELTKFEATPSYQTKTKWLHLANSFLRPHISSKSPSSQRPAKTAVKRELPVETAEPEEPKRSAPDEREGDHFDYFGKHVSEQLKSLPPKVAMETQFRIQAMLTDQTIVGEKEQA